MVHVAVICVRWPWPHGNVPQARVLSWADMVNNNTEDFDDPGYEPYPVLSILIPATGKEPR